METTTSLKTAIMKPLLLKAGVPLVMSIASFVCAGFLARRSIKYYLKWQVTDRERRIDSSNSKSTISVRVKDDSDDYEDEQMVMVIESPDLFYSCNKSNHLFKEQESVLLKLKGMLMLVDARLEFLDRELVSMEAEKERMENFVIWYLRVFEQLHVVKIENGLLRKKVKKLSRKTKEQFQVLKEKNAKIEEAEAEVSRQHEKIETTIGMIKKLEAEVSELKNIVNKLQEKNEVLLKLNFAESSLSKIESEAKTTKENHTQVVSELEQLRKVRAEEVSELIYLRWVNACMRHESMRSHLQQHHQITRRKKFFELLELEAPDANKHQEVTGDTCNNVVSLKRHKFLKMIKRWVVEGNKTSKSNFKEEKKHDFSCSF